MATLKTSATGRDYLKLGILKDFQINPLTTAQITTLAGGLGAPHEGLVVYDTDLNILKVWTGTVFAANPTTQSGLTPKGNKAFNDTEPASPVIGDLYVFTTAGSNTWEGTTVVQVGDQVYWDGTVWQFIQGNAVLSSETIAGLIEIATQAETNAGANDTFAITPLKLKTYLDTVKAAKVYFNASMTTVADVALTVTHSLALQNRDAFVLSFKVGNSEVDVDVDSIDVNSCSITSSVALTGAVTVIGF